MDDEHNQPFEAEARLNKYLRNQSKLQRKHFSMTKIKWLVLFTLNHINPVSTKYTQLFTDKVAGTYHYH
jgi:hypothetical protein